MYADKVFSHHDDNSIVNAYFSSKLRGKQDARVHMLTRPEAALAKRSIHLTMYGRTNAGKSHTLLGAGGPDSSQEGLLQHSLNTLFKLDNVLSVAIKAFTVTDNIIVDCLSGSPRSIKTAPTHKFDDLVNGMTVEVAKNADQGIRIIKKALSKRETRDNGAHSQSSRSHFCIKMVSCLLCLFVSTSLSPSSLSSSSSFLLVDPPSHSSQSVHTPFPELEILVLS